VLHRQLEPPVQPPGTRTRIPLGCAVMLLLKPPPPPPPPPPSAATTTTGHARSAVDGGARCVTHACHHIAAEWVELP
jgi:hypothetical protein